MAKEKKEKKPKAEKGEKKEKKGKKGAEGGDGEEAPAGGKKKLVMILAVLVLLLGGGGAAAYFMVYLPSLEEVTEDAVVEETTTPLVSMDSIKPSGYFGYLSYNGEGKNALLIDSVDLIRADETLLMEKMGLTEDQMTSGYYISNPQPATRYIYVDQVTEFQIISRETGNLEEATWSEFLVHLGSSAILFEIESYNNILLSVIEFPVNESIDEFGNSTSAIPSLPAGPVDPNALVEPEDQGPTTGAPDPNMPGVGITEPGTTAPDSVPGIEGYIPEVVPWQAPGAQESPVPGSSLPGTIMPSEANGIL